MIGPPERIFPRTLFVPIALLSVPVFFSSILFPDPSDAASKGSIHQTKPRAEAGKEAKTPPLSHVVRPGETLRGIALRYNRSARAVAAANPQINPDRLRVGQRLAIPPSEAPRGQITPSARRKPAMTLPAAAIAAGDELPVLMWPLKGRISSGYGMRRHPILRSRLFHQGIDIAAPQGELIVAALGGEVTFSGWKPRYGKVIFIDHEDGVSTIYAHNSENLVEAGDHVLAGSPIARVGKTGLATGPHLYFEVRRDGRHLNPMLAMKLEPPKNPEVLLAARQPHLRPSTGGAAEPPAPRGTALKRPLREGGTVEEPAFLLLP